MFKVYFDTSFYVNLAKADEELATAVISEINSCQVRCVISDILIRELLSNSSSPERDRVLVSRLQALNLPPFSTRSGLLWEVLLMSGEDRSFVGDTLKNLDDMMTQANSFSIMARRDPRKLTPEQEAQLDEAGRPVLRQAGFPEEFNEHNVEDVIAAARQMLEGFGITGVDWNVEHTPEGMNALAQRLFAIIGEQQVARLREGDRLQDSVTQSDSRPYEVAAGIAQQKTKKRLGNTLRDVSHMDTFVAHADQIDFLQLDEPQLRAVKHQKPSHYLVELGLTDRCFAAGNLEQIITVVRGLRKVKP